MNLIIKSVITLLLTVSGLSKAMESQTPPTQPDAITQALQEKFLKFSTLQAQCPACSVAHPTIYLLAEHLAQVHGQHNAFKNAQTIFRNQLKKL